MSKHDRAMAAFLQALAGGVEGGADADRLTAAASAALVEALREAHDIHIAACTSLLEAAEAALDRAEAALPDSEERRRQLSLFELLMSAATV